MKVEYVTAKLVRRNNKSKVYEFHLLCNITPKVIAALNEIVEKIIIEYRFDNYALNICSFTRCILSTF